MVTRATAYWTERIPNEMFPGYLPLAVLALPALLLSVVAAGSGSLPGDLAVMRWVQSEVPQDLSLLFETVNLIGDTAGAIVITIAIASVLFAIRSTTFAALLLLTLPVRASNVLLKLIADSPRPTDDLVRVTEAAGGMGFPSGHTMGATLLYGMIIIAASRIIVRRAARLAIQIAASIMLLLAGISRIYVGAHWPSDVLGGYIFGAIGLILLISLAGRLPALSTGTQYR